MLEKDGHVHSIRVASAVFIIREKDTRCAITRGTIRGILCRPTIIGRSSERVNISHVGDIKRASGLETGPPHVHKMDRLKRWAGFEKRAASRTRFPLFYGVS